MIPDTLDHKIHGGEAKYMVAKPYMVGSPHAWWPGQPAGQLWWGARLNGGQGGAPSMYFDQGYQDFRYQVSEKRREQQKNFFLKVENKFQQIARFEAMTP